MTNGLILSSSSIARYLSCPKAWYYAHIQRLPETQNVAAVIGIATHAGIEAAHRGERAPEALQAAFEREVASVPASDLEADPGALQSARQMAAAFVTKWPTWNPDLVEQPFTMRTLDVTVTGTLDSADTRTDEVSDIKTTDSKRFKPESHRLQMTIYGLGYKVLTGRAAKKLVLRVLTRSGNARQYEVLPDYAELRTAIEITREGIARSDFSPYGAAAGKCHFCPYRLTCSDSTYLKETP